MKRIIFATGNEGKLREIRMILKDFPVEIVSMKEAGIDVDIDENGTTFEENALIKARTIMKMTGDIVLADDSGLEIDYFDGAPGVYSARFLGENTSYDVKNQYILDKMENVPEEKAHSKICLCDGCCISGWHRSYAPGTIEGMIGYEIAGENGFGYDPIFFVPEYGCMSAQLEPDVKNEISHRGKALRALRDAIGDRLK